MGRSRLHFVGGVGWGGGGAFLTSLWCLKQFSFRANSGDYLGVCPSLKAVRPFVSCEFLSVAHGFSDSYGPQTVLVIS